VNELLRGVRLLSLDAGNTVIFLDHARLAKLAARHGLVTDAATLIQAEGAAKRRLPSVAPGVTSSGTMVHAEWPSSGEPGARGWGAMVATTLVEAGLPVERAGEVIEDLWREHVAKNLWSLVPPDLPAALDAMRANGIPVVLVSNSEGMLERLFRQLGILEHFDLLLDSGIVGLEKPDPRFFQVALDHFKVPAADAIHLGDIFQTDIAGARATGMRSALVDPYGHYEGMYPDVPRVPGAAEVARALAVAAGAST
jgi:HAD superfamily hydrolase (TIGR01509 family)